MPTQDTVHPQLLRMAEDCPEALTDEELMLVLCAPGMGCADRLFGEIFRRYQARVISWCFRMTHDRSRALDLAQEVFFKAYRHRQGFRGDSRFSTWLYSIARNHCLSSLKKTADPADVGEMFPLRLQDFSAIRPDIVIEKKEQQREIWSMMDSALEPMEVRVMALHYGYELPLAEITQRLALTNPSGAKAYVVNARRKLNLAIKRRTSRNAFAPRNASSKTAA